MPKSPPSALFDFRNYRSGFIVRRRARNAIMTETASSSPVTFFPPAEGVSAPVPPQTPGTAPGAPLDLDALRAKGEKLVKERPAEALLCAVGAGFVLGLLFRR